MDIFVFAFGAIAEDPQQLVRQTRAGLATLFTDVLQTRQSPVLETHLSHAVCLTTEDAERSERQISQAAGHDHFLLIYGDRSEVSAQEWVERLESGRPSEVISEMAGGDGCFGCLVYHKPTQTVYLFGDAAGQRTLRWAIGANGSLVVSSHDVGLVAAGAVVPEIDRTSLDSVLSMGWSVSDYSLLAGISVCRAGQIVSLRAGGSDRAEPKIEVAPLEPRVDGTDEPLTGILLGSLDRRLPGKGPVRVELTAGFDSRASVAALLALREARDITVFTEGPDDAVDVVEARRIAQIAGLKFEHRHTSNPDRDGFRTAWSRTAARCNGMIEISVLASRNAADEMGMAPLTVSGDIGEVFHGYYQSFRPFPRLLGLPVGAADGILGRKMVSRTLPQDRQSNLRARLSECVADLRVAAISEWRVLDLYLQTQRFGVWNQRVARDRAHQNRIGLFYSRHAMLRANASEDDAQQARRLHFDLIRAHLPSALDIPINGEETVWRHGGGRWNDLRLDISSLQGKVGRRIRSKLGRKSTDLEASRAAAITRVCAEILSDADFVAPEGRFGGKVEEIERQIADGGSRSWAELGALRFLRICDRVHAAVATPGMRLDRGRVASPVFETEAAARIFPASRRAS